MARRVVLGNLPAELTSFVGRRGELAEVKRLLAEARLVTLLGAGGTGKTRLALRTAADLRRAFPDGVWFVDLTRLPDSGLLAQEVQDSAMLAYLVGGALGLRDPGGMSPMRRLAEHLTGRQALLVVDNCEHLVPACAVLVDELLRSCPALRVLATSREPLAIAGEVSFVVPPLPAPPADGRWNLAGVGGYEAATLFTARAQSVDPGFRLTADNRAAVAEICHRLDGLPLAVELAAAWIRVLSPQQILDRLTDRFTLLRQGSRAGPPRQRTLRACMDWSFELCSKPERVLWARLSVFAGGFELDAVEGICTDDVVPAGDLLEVVAGLVDKSVIRRDDGYHERARYRMLETVRAFGKDKLVEAGQLDTLRRRHRDWFQQLVARAAADWVSERQAHWMGRLDRGHSNLRAALEYSLAEPGRAEGALRLVVDLPGLYWLTTGSYSEGRSWLDLALAQATAPTALRARGLLLAGQMAIIQNQAEAGMRLLAEGESLAVRLGATLETALAMYVRAQDRLYRGELAAVIEAHERVGEILATVRRHEPGLALELSLGRLIALGTTTALTGDHDRADGHFREALAIVEPRGESRFRSYALWGQALSAWRQGALDRTVALLEQSLRLKQTPGDIDRYGTARCLEVLAWAAARRRQYRRAATLLGALDALWTAIGLAAATFGHLSDDQRACERETRAGLGDAAYAEAFARGQALSYGDAIGYALQEPREPAVAARGAPTPLTRRERQVADLIAEGLSNKEIAAALVISQRTAESHVEHILTKLGCTGRAQVAAWVAAERADGRPR